MQQGEQWPPLPPQVTGLLDDWKAWYQGTPPANALRPVTRPTQMMGGVVGATARALWGRPYGEAEHRYLHMPLAADIAQASADLLFGEELGVTWESQRFDDRAAYLLEGNAFQSQLLEAAELAAALGGVYLRVGWDQSVADHALLSVLPHDAVAPTFRYGRMVRATTWQVVRTEAGAVWRHLEVHTPGTVVHQLWRGSSSHLGTQLALTDHPATEDLSPEPLYTGCQGLAVVYVPNVRPAPAWLDDPCGKNLGRSDFGSGGTTGFLSALDDAWTSWMRDLRLGKARLLVASQMLDSRTPGAGADFDLDREVYEAVKFAQGEDATLGNMVSAQQFAIRTTEHAATVQALMEVVIRNCGYSGSTFGLPSSEGDKTATEISSIDRRSRTTREKKTRLWTTALEELLFTLATVDAHVFGHAAPTLRPRVVFPPVAQPDPVQLATSVATLRGAQALSIETAVRMAQPDLDEAGVQAEIARIQDETGVLVNDANMQHNREETYAIAEGS